MLDDLKTTEMLKASEPTCPEVDKAALVELLTKRTAHVAVPQQRSTGVRTYVLFVTACAAVLLFMFLMPSPTAAPILTNESEFASLEKEYQQFREAAQQTEIELEQMLTQLGTSRYLDHSAIQAIENTTTQIRASEALLLLSGRTENPTLKKDVLVSLNQLYPNSPASSRIGRSVFDQ